MKAILAVIDDEEEILETYSDYFSDTYKVLLFDKPEKFLQALFKGEAKPDAVITDFKMPSMTGIELMYQIRDKGWHTPVILLSGYVEKDVALEAIRLGVSAVLEKPISFDKLKNIVERVMYEAELEKLRAEIRQSVLQIKELYEGIREALLPHVPQEVLNRFFIEANDGVVTRKLGLESVLEDLEKKLELLLKSEKSVTSLRQTAEDKQYHGR